MADCPIMTTQAFSYTTPSSKRLDAFSNILKGLKKTRPFVLAAGHILIIEHC